MGRVEEGRQIGTYMGGVGELMSVGAGSRIQGQGSSRVDKERAAWSDGEGATGM